MSGESREVRLGNWVGLAGKWEAELDGFLPVPIDLDLGDSDLSVDVVAPALKRDGVCIYRKANRKKLRAT